MLIITTIVGTIQKSYRSVTLPAMTSGEWANRDEFLSAVYHALRASRRRQTIQILTEQGNDVDTVRELARRITAREEGVSVENATGEPYRNVYNALSQTHLPTLADAGIVIYSSQRQRVKKGPNFKFAAILVAIDEPTIEVLRTIGFSEELDSLD